MSDTSGQPTQEEIEAYYAELREAPLEELLMQSVGMLAAGAEAKLGRRDARVLIDSMAALVKIGAGHLGEAESQLQGAVSQLQTAQVQVEKQMAAQAAEGEAPADGQDPPAAQGAAGAPARPAGSGQEHPAQQPPVADGQKATDKLWIPGR